MKKNNSIVDKISGERVVSSSDKRLAAFFGDKAPRKPTYYKHKQTGIKYAYITGVSWWPEKIAPGFIVIVGVESTDDPNPSFFVLDEWEDDNIQRLLLKCVELREKWGFLVCSELFRPWHGEYEKYYSIIDSFNRYLERTRKEGFYPSLPTVLEEKNAFSICVRQAFSLLEKDKSGKKRLHIGDCGLLRDHFLRLRKDDPKKWKAEHHPSLMAIGIAIHVLLESTPWLIEADYNRASFEDYATKELETTMRLFGQEEYDFNADGVYEDQDWEGEGGGGDLVETIG